MNTRKGMGIKHRKGKNIEGKINDRKDGKRKIKKGEGNTRAEERGEERKKERKKERKEQTGAAWR